MPENATSRALREAIQRRLYSLGEAAHEVGVSPSTIKMAELAGRLPPARRDEGGARYYTRDELDALIERLVNASMRSRR